MNTCYFIQRWGIVRVIALCILVAAGITGCSGQQMAGVGTGGTGGNQLVMGGSVQGKVLALKTAVTTIAGAASTVAGTPIWADGVGTSARFSCPTGIVTDGVNLYVADTFNHIIRKIVIATGAVSTLAGSAGSMGWADGIGAAAKFAEPTGITTDGTNLYIADTFNQVIRKIVIETGMVTTITGTVGRLGAADGTGTASFNYPSGITTDGTNLYVADSSNYTIRKIVIATGEVTTLAGTAGNSGSANGSGAAARFQSPLGITTDGSNLYVADSYDGIGSTIRKVVIATGSVSTLASIADTSGSTDGTGAAARSFLPMGIATDGTNVYVPDFVNNEIRKIVIATGVVTTLAGGYLGGSSADGIGAAASFLNPRGISTDGTNLYVSDSNNNLIRKIVIATGTVTTLAGASNLTDGDGIAARFNYPSDVTTDGTNLYVTDTDNFAIRKIVIATGTVSTLVGGTILINPTGITTDGTNLYVTDLTTIRKIVIGTGAVTTVAGTRYVLGHDDGTGGGASFFEPKGITTDGVNLYVVGRLNSTIRKIVIATGVVTTLAGSPGNSGYVDGIGAAARFSYLSGITTDGMNLYVTDQSTIRKVVISTGEVTTIAGIAWNSGSSDGVGAAACFNTPQGITSDGTNLYVTDTGYSSGNDTIRKIVIATGEVTTLAGTAGKRGSADGTGATARFNYPQGITTDGRSLYVADTFNSIIRKIQ